ncbi:MAG: hypothetical protein IPF92_26360 [Myxococcales bacterium]|nr:hypothetical protein [Myxococcales bacterium]MBL0194214.1 hypothetical protein [Myxococcales bacterium]HQY64128.1 hypothetical protein [Polyangiaceae bacterium]
MASSALSPEAVVRSPAPPASRRSHLSLRALGVVGALAAITLTGCDFGTLDSLSTDVAGEGGSELSLLSRGLLSKYQAGSDAEYKTLVRDIEGVMQRAIDGNGGDSNLKLEPLKPADIADLGLPPRDVTAAQGMIILTELPCTLSQVEKLTAAKNQPELFPKTYDNYLRTYTSSSEDYFARKVKTLTWTTDLTATVLSRQYQSDLRGSVRFVPGAGPTGGDLVLSRTVLVKPATFLKGSDAQFNQDYQIEAFYERAAGRTVHVYALWRQFLVGSISSADDLYISIILGNLKDFDVRVGKICREGTPLPDVR